MHLCNALDDRKIISRVVVLLDRCKIQKNGLRSREWAKKLRCQAIGLCILLLLACEELSCISNKFSFLGVAPALREREEPPDKSLAYIE